MGSRERVSGIWDHFTVSSELEKKAICNYCKITVRFTTSSNLRRHLNIKHPSVNIRATYRQRSPSSEKEETTRLESSIWKYFTPEPKYKARCNYCKEIFGRVNGNLRRHLKLRHVNDLVQPIVENGLRSPITKQGKEIKKDLDSSLSLKVRKYMEKNELINIEDMTVYLMQNFEEFKNKRKKPFMRHVNKVYQLELKNNKLDDDAASENSANEDEEEEDISVSEEEYIYPERESSPDSVEISTTNKKDQNKNLELSSSFSVGHLYKTSTPATNGPTSDSISAKHQETPQSIKNLKRKRIHENDDDDDDNDNSPTRSSKTRKSDTEELIPTCTLSDFIGKESVHGIGLIYKYLRGDQRLHLPRTSLISGAKGSGKSMLVECLAGHLRYPLYRISASELRGENEVDIRELLPEIMKEALSNAPCVLHIDKLDDISSSKKFGTTKNSESKVIDQLKQLVKEFATTYSTEQVLLIAESRSPMIDTELLSFIDLEITIPVLNKESKILILKEFFFEKGWLSSDVNLEDIAEQATSFVAGDFKVLAKKAAIHAGFREMSKKTQNNFPNHIYFEQTDLPDIEIKMKDILTVLPTIKPTLKEELFPHPSNVKWEDVHGLEDVKKSILRKIISPIKDKEIFAHFGIKKPNGILLYGPSGCGKTLLGEAIANAAGINLLSVKGPELVSTDQGESERNVREVFRRAESAAPCLIFFDEFDYLCPKKTENADYGSKHSIVNTLLVEMNGLNEKHEVYVIAATNRPEFIDPVVLRPNRIETKLYVGFPDDKGRVDIFKSCSEKQKVQLDYDVDFEEIASWCGNFSGADCSSLLKAACEEAILEIHSMYKEGKLELEDVKITKEHFETALRIVRGSVSTEVHQEYLDMKARFEKSLKG